jgi:hypothetical protein
MKRLLLSIASSLLIIISIFVVAALARGLKLSPEIQSVFHRLLLWPLIVIAPILHLNADGVGLPPQELIVVAIIMEVTVYSVLIYAILWQRAKRPD